MFKVYSSMNYGCRVSNFKIYTLKDRIGEYLMFEPFKFLSRLNQGWIKNYLCNKIMVKCNNLYVDIVRLIRVRFLRVR